MPASTPVSTRPYVSRRKRRSSIEDPFSTSGKITFGVLGLLLLGLLLSLGIIATHLVSPASDTATASSHSAPSTLPIQLH